MIPLLVGGVLISLIGFVMLVAAAFAVSTAWGVLSLLPPLGWLFAALHWQKSWDGVMLQALGLAMTAVFWLQLQGEGISVAEAWTKFQREQGMVVVPTGSETTVLGDQPVQAATQEAGAVDSGVVQSVAGDEAVVAVKGAAKVEVDDKPIHKCIDPDGKESFSRGPCPTGVKKTP